MRKVISCREHAKFLPGGDGKVKAKAHCLPESVCKGLREMEVDRLQVQVPPMVIGYVVGRYRSQ